MLLTALVPGDVAERPPDPQPPGSLHVGEVSIAAGPVSGASASSMPRGGDYRLATVA